MEYKFRGKRVDNNEWVYGFILYTNGNINQSGHLLSAGWYIYNPEKNISLGVIPKSVGLFIGILDKNFKEIYGGDIVKIQIKIGYCPIEFKAIIQFRNGCFWFDGIDATITDCNWHFYNSSDIEIIGNIFENPELKEIKQ